jgi:tetratricopeptide (TPR) repeat protein
MGKLLCMGLQPEWIFRRRLLAVSKPQQHRNSCDFGVEFGIRHFGYGLLLHRMFNRRQPRMNIRGGGSRHLVAPRDLKMSPTEFTAHVQSYLDERKLKTSPAEVAARVRVHLAELKSKMTPEQIADAEKAADIDDARAAMTKGREEDYVTALKLLRPLAEEGNASAEQLVGTVYFHQNNMVEAVKWYRKAGDQGYGQAQRNLGYHYQKGIGVLRDVVTADMWLNLAAAAGESDAADERDELEKRMSPAQIAEAEKLAREWKPITQPSGR